MSGEDKGKIGWRWGAISIIIIGMIIDIIIIGMIIFILLCKDLSSQDLSTKFIILINSLLIISIVLLIVSIVLLISEIWYINKRYVLDEFIKKVGKLIGKDNKNGVNEIDVNAKEFKISLDMDGYSFSLEVKNDGVPEAQGTSGTSDTKQSQPKLDAEEKNKRNNG